MVEHLYAQNNSVPNAAEDGFVQVFMTWLDDETPGDPRSHCFVSKDRVWVVDPPVNWWCFASRAAASDMVSPKTELPSEAFRYAKCTPTPSIGGG